MRSPGLIIANLILLAFGAAGWILWYGSRAIPAPVVGAAAGSGAIGAVMLPGPVPDLRQVPVPAQTEVDIHKAGNFWDAWKLLNVRFREDNGEQRYVYANPIAWRAIVERQSKFPEGAMFGKIAFHTDLDPLFPVSRESHGFTRIQLMVKDSRKYAAHGGWGYSIVAPVGGTEKVVVDDGVSPNCYSCHTLAAERDYVFTNSAFLDRALPPLQNFRTRFIDKRIEDLNPVERQALALLVGERSGAVKYYSSTLFGGSVNEALPVVSDLAEKDRLTYVVSDTAQSYLLIADPVDNCKGSKILATVNVINAGQPKRKVKVGTLCEHKIAWKAVFELKEKSISTE